MTHGLNWDEFRLVRAIAEAHSLGGAAERLGLNHSTLFRRLAALESRLGVKLFERERSGYRPTAAGEDMVSLASLMGETIAEFERRVARSEVKLSGRLRLTTTNTLGLLVLPDLCAELHAAHPGLHLDVVISETQLDLEHGQADIAIRVLQGEPPAGLAAQKIAQLPWAIYAAPNAGDAAGADNWIMPAEGCGPSQARGWMDRNAEAWRRTATASHIHLMAELAARGLGAALLPCYLAARRPELRRIGGIEPQIPQGVWLLAAERALKTPRVRAAYDHLSAALAARRALFEDQDDADA